MSNKKIIRIVNKLVSLWEQQKIKYDELTETEKKIYEKIKILFY